MLAAVTPENCDGCGGLTDWETEPVRAVLASEGTEVSSQVCARDVLTSLTAAIKEPFLLQSGPPGGDVQEGRDVVSGEGLAC